MPSLQLPQNILQRIRTIANKHGLSGQAELGYLPNKGRSDLVMKAFLPHGQPVASVTFEDFDFCDENTALTEFENSIVRQLQYWDYLLRRKFSDTDCQSF